MTIQDVVVLPGGELATDVAAQIESKLSITGIKVRHVPMSKSKHFKAALVGDGDDAELSSLAKPTTLAVFVVQTIENESPPEEAGACVRFFKRKTHPDTLLTDRVQFAVLGLGDSNLLLDRQHTSAKDCNQVAQALDLRLEALGGTRFVEQGEADERTGLTEVEPWIDALVSKLKEQ
jgi:sulfite reductase alpha subunit-like flavoprotein